MQARAQVTAATLAPEMEQASAPAWALASEPAMAPGLGAGLGQVLAGLMAKATVAC